MDQAARRSFADHALGITTARGLIRLAGLLRANGSLSEDEYEALHASFTADLDVWQTKLSSPDLSEAARQTAAEMENFREVLDLQWRRAGPQ